MTNEKKADQLSKRIFGFMAAVKETYNVQIHPEAGRRFLKFTVGNRVYCFVDMTNGDVLKAESWRKPAMHARSNVHDADFGLSGVNEYGGIYLK